MKKICHGSAKIIEKPVYVAGKRYNDYGLGFYCTEDINMAKEWGTTGGKNGYANIYEIEEDGLNIMNLNDSKYGIINWLAVLLDNRTFEISSMLAMEAKDYILYNFLPDYQNQDIIIGYRADDSYFSFAQNFLNGAISVRQLRNAMHLGKLGEQYVLKSRKAFEQLHFVGYEIASREEWYARKLLRDKTARQEYFNAERNKRQRGDIFVLQIIDEGMKSDDLRLR